MPTRVKQVNKKILIGLSIVFSFYFLCFNYTDTHEVSISRNFVTGEIWIDSVPGFCVTSPFTQVSNIDTRPIRVNVPSSSRNFNGRLIEFNSKEWRTLIEYEGFHYYWWNNRISFNSGHNDEYRGIKDILIGYAYDQHPPKFIKVTRITQ